MALTSGLQFPMLFGVSNFVCVEIKNDEAYVGALQR